MPRPFAYVVEHYGVPACIGRRVVVDGQAGVIAEDRGHHLGVLFDSDKPGNVKPVHPTWRVEYQSIGPVRRPTRSQRRYQRYLDVADCFASFRDFLRWESRQRGTAV